MEPKQQEQRRPHALNLLLLSSLSLNLFFFYHFSLIPRQPQLRWTLAAAAEAEAVAAIDCSGHGRAFLDSVVTAGGIPTCECNACYGGSDCSRLLPDCPADADGGELLLLETYWQRKAASSAVVFSGWHRMGYEASGDNFISLELERHIRLLHNAVGNAVTDGKFIVFGTGSTQLFNALVYALSPDNTSSSPARVVSTAPYYPIFKSQTKLMDGRKYEWGGITSEWVNAPASSASNFIEFVTSPNNPDGILRRSVLNGSSVINDYAYYWPHYTAIPAPADEDIMLFSTSKISGHASSRFGWVVIKDEKIYQKVTDYMSLSTMGVSRDTQLRVLKLIKVMIAEKGGEDDIFMFGYRTMKERWSKLHRILSASNRFSLQKLPPQFCSYFNYKIREPSPAYAWLKCEREEDDDCYAVLKKAGILSRSGIVFEADRRHTRLSLIRLQDDFDLMQQRLEALVATEAVAAS